MRKGQAALEFLTTYGWAILIILVMISAIAYFGIVNPDKFLPTRCIVSPEFNCQDFQALSSGPVSIQLRQGLGKTIYWNGTTCSYAGSGTVTNVQATATINGVALVTGGAWSPRDTVSFTCTFNSGLMGGFKNQKMKILYNMTYQTSSIGLPHTADGEVFAEVQ